MLPASRARGAASCRSLHAGACLMPSARCTNRDRSDPPHEHDVASPQSRCSALERTPELYLRCCIALPARTSLDSASRLHVRPRSGRGVEIIDGGCEPLQASRTEPMASLLQRDSGHGSRAALPPGAASASPPQPPALTTARHALQRVVDQVNRIILGKEQQIRLTLACLLARGHLLIRSARCQESDAGPCIGRFVGLRSAHPVHQRPAAGRHHRGVHSIARAQFPLPPRPDLHPNDSSG